MSMHGETNCYHDVDHVVETIFVLSPGERLRVQAKPVGESKTVQSDADACDINKIISRYENTGFLPPVMKQGVYDDVSALNRDLTELVVEAGNSIRSYNDFLIAKSNKVQDTLPPSQTSSVTEPAKAGE